MNHIIDIACGTTPLNGGFSADRCKANVVYYSEQSTSTALLVGFKISSDHLSCDVYIRTQGQMAQDRTSISLLGTSCERQMLTIQLDGTEDISITDENYTEILDVSYMLVDNASFRLAKFINNNYYNIDYPKLSSFYFGNVHSADTIIITANSSNYARFSGFISTTRITASLILGFGATRQPLLQSYNQLTSVTSIDPYITITKDTDHDRFTINVADTEIVYFYGLARYINVGLAVAPTE